MDLSFLMKGIILGITIAAPVGPIGILCIRRTLQFGRFSGFFSGLGAAVADTFYGLVTAFGLTFISSFLIAQQFWLRLIGGGFLLCLGAKMFFTRRQEHQKEVTHKTLLSDFISTFFLTITNPMTILAFVAIFAGLGLSDMHENYWNALELVFGVFVGSTVWWLVLCEGITLFRKRLNQTVMVWINRIAGLIIAAFGAGIWICMMCM